MKLHCTDQMFVPENKSEDDYFYVLVAEKQHSSCAGIARMCRMLNPSAGHYSKAATNAFH